jgi:hypothetical protein
MVYALLDEQSDACFIKDSVLNVLEVDGPEVQLELSTVLSHEVIKCQKITGLVCRGMNCRSIPTENIYEKSDSSQIRADTKTRVSPYVAASGKDRGETNAVSK